MDVIALVFSLLALAGVAYLLWKRPKKVAGPGTVKEGGVFVRQYGGDTVLEDFDGNQIMKL